jgi:indole-3-glycerol phosphate synthase
MGSLMDAPDVLKRIAAYKAEEVASLKARTTIETLRKQAAALARPRGFKAAIRNATGPALICEVKKASPSKGIIREDFNAHAIARAYTAGGATCLSVLTDGPGFQGSNAIFKAVRETTALPLLRKDFMLDPIQIAESAAMGADCILIIMAMIDDETAAELFTEAKALGLDALVETHDEAELRRAIDLGATLIGINNRDLRTFDTTLDTFDRLAPMAPSGCTLIAESGIFTQDDILRLAENGAQGYLIGESLMRQDDVEAATRTLMG